MKRLSGLLATALFALAWPALAAIPVSPTTVTDDRLPPARVKIGDVTVTTDIAYRTLPGFRPLRLDLYTPAGKAARPLVVFVHGGGWTIGSKRATANYADFPGVLAELARRGFAVAAVEYRLSGEAPFPGAADDVKAAIGFLSANAARYGIDAGRIAVWGGSAGAHLAALAALSCGETPQDPCVQAFVGWYGPYDIAAMLKGAKAAQPAAGAPAPTAQERAESEGGLAFFNCTASGCLTDLAAASPINHVDAGDPPSLLLHGTADTLVPDSQTQAMAARMRKAGVPVEVVLIDGVGHGWVGADHAATTIASQRAVAVTFDWLEQRFGMSSK